MGGVDLVEGDAIGAVGGGRVLILAPCLVPFGTIRAGGGGGALSRNESSGGDAADWEAITTRDGLLALGIDVPASTYVGFQKLVDWALGVPLFLGAFLYPLIIFGAVLALLEKWSENPR